MCTHTLQIKIDIDCSRTISMGVEDNSMVKYCLLGYILAAIIIIITGDTIVYTSYEYATLLLYPPLYPHTSLHVPMHCYHVPKST